MRKIGENYGVVIDEDLSIKMYFNELMEKLYKEVGKGVVILINEYDKPIIDHIGKGGKELDIARENRELLRSFYGTLKSVECGFKDKVCIYNGSYKVFKGINIFRAKQFK